MNSQHRIDLFFRRFAPAAIVAVALLGATPHGQAMSTSAHSATEKATMTRSSIAESPAAASAPDTSADEESAPTRLLATIDGVDVTAADADALRALLQPPPSRDEADRLAVDVALAWWDIHGWLAGSSAQGRLDAWRAWLVAGQDLGESSAVEAIAEVARRAATGHAGSTRADRSRHLWMKSGTQSNALPVWWFRLAPDGRFESRDVHMSLRDLEPALALAVVGLPVGETSSAVISPSGIYWVRRMAETTVDLPKSAVAVTP